MMSERQDAIRKAALSMAVDRLRQATTAAVSADFIVDTARVFELYLSGDAPDNSREPVQVKQHGPVKKN